MGPTRLSFRHIFTDHPVSDTWHKNVGQSCLRHRSVAIRVFNCTDSQEHDAGRCNGWIEVLFEAGLFKVTRGSGMAGSCTSDIL